MSVLSEILTYWANNSTLNTALASTSLYLSQAPEGTSFPYGLIIPVSSTLLDISDQALISYTIQFSIYHSDSVACNNICNAVLSQFYSQDITGDTAACYIGNYIAPVLDSETPVRVYQGIVEIQLMQNRDLANMN